MVKGFGVLTKAVMSEDSEVDLGFKRLIAHFCSRAAGCQYCEAHSLIAAEIHGVSPEKVQAIWDYKTSDLYTEAERVALDYALAAGSVPNAVDEEMMIEMKKHWSENQIVEILGAICLYGFLNRWNDSMGTSIEDGAVESAEKYLGEVGWQKGKHDNRMCSSIAHCSPV